jgi:hypothetical protein
MGTLLLTKAVQHSHDSLQVLMNPSAASPRERNIEIRYPVPSANAFHIRDNPKPRTTTVTGIPVSAISASRPDTQSHFSMVTTSPIAAAKIAAVVSQ